MCRDICQPESCCSGMLEKNQSLMTVPYAKALCQSLMPKPYGRALLQCLMPKSCVKALCQGLMTEPYAKALCHQPKLCRSGMPEKKNQCLFISVSLMSKPYDSALLFRPYVKALCQGLMSKPYDSALCQSLVPRSHGSALCQGLMTEPYAKALCHQPKLCRSGMPEKKNQCLFISVSICDAGLMPSLYLDMCVWTCAQICVWTRVQTCA